MTGFAAAAYFFEDFVSGGMPLERFRIFVPVGDPRGDGVDQMWDAGEGASPEPAVGQLLEPAARLSHDELVGV